MVGASTLLPVLPDLDRTWSRMVTAPGAHGSDTFHVLDNGGSGEAGTLLCVHGNPTWSYLWRRVLRQAPPGWRVIAVDHLGMGYSSDTRHPRRLAERISDLSTVLDALGVQGRVSLAVHDWGGPIGLGWAGRHPERIRSLVVTNTAVHQSGEDKAPLAIRLARSGPLLRTVCRSTPAFVRAATGVSRLAGNRLHEDVRDAFAAPYADAGSRQAVLDFVADIPLESTHPSRETLDRVQRDLTGLTRVPTLMLWGTKDPVFSDRYLQDLTERLPRARVHRYEDAGHLVLEDRPDAVERLWTFLQDSVDTTARAGGATASEPGPDARIRVAPDAEGTAIVELDADARRTLTFAELRARVAVVAERLSAAGVERGHRVSVLVPPGADLTVVAYALWSLGAVVVVADAGLGLRPLGRALRGARPQHVVGIPRGLAAATALRIPGRRIRVSSLLHGVDQVTGDAAPAATAQQSVGSVDPDADAAILFTSGATGPPKGVVYTARQLLAQIAVLRDAFAIGPDDAFVAAFAPFALYGPALGIRSSVPEHALEPHRLTVHDLARAVEAIDATMVFASPRALRAVVASGDTVTDRERGVLAGPRLLLSAGAPVPVPLLRRVRALLPQARTQTPYGMTEALPVASADPVELADAGLEPQDGVCVGEPVPGVEVRIAPLAADGTPDRELGADVLGVEPTPGVLGEIVVRAPHVKDRYDRLWATQYDTSEPGGWHRTGDVGHVDAAGRLWVEGRLVHVLATERGPLAPVGAEQRVETLPEVESAAVVGVGPTGLQQVVVVLTLPEGTRGRRRLLAGHELTERVREVAGVPVSAVLVRRRMPVDIRHRSKIDRTALAAWAASALDGRNPG